MRILVCDADYKHALGIVRALGKAGHQSYALAVGRRSLCFSSRYCAGELIAPDYDDPAFQHSLLELIERQHIELVIPVGTRSFKKLSSCKEEILRRANIVIADNDAINFCMSKELTYQHAARIGLPVPKTMYPYDMEQVAEFGKEIAYPCVLKGRFEVGYNIVTYANHRDDLIRKYQTLCTRHNLVKSEELPMVQEYITGDGYGFFAIYNNGQCGPTFQHHRLREFPPSGGFSVASESDCHPRVLEFGKRLLDSLNWHGVAMVEFRMNAEGVPVLMEINPKFWGSLDLALEAGVDFPSAMVDVACKRDLQFCHEYRYPFRYHWPLHGDLLHAIMKPRNLVAVLGDCLNPRVGSNMWLMDDFRGTMGICRSVIKKAFRKLLTR